MPKYTITIKETLIRDVEVEASSAEEATRLVETDYYDGTIVLTADDYTETEFTLLD